MNCKENLLNDTKIAVTNRGGMYGPVEDHFSRTVGMINALFKDRLLYPLEPGDWGVMMMLDKIARNQHTHQRDNCIDIAGYAACMQELADQCDDCDCNVAQSGGLSCAES